MTPGVPPTTDGRGGAGGRTAGGGLAADGEATQSKEDDLRMWLREDVLEKGGIYDMPDREGRLPGCETARFLRAWYHATWAITPHVSLMADFSNNLMSNHGLAFLVVDVIIPVM